jgi:hypothetical protein
MDNRGQAILPAAGFLAGLVWMRLCCSVGQTIAVCGLPSSRRTQQQATRIDRLLHLKHNPLLLLDAAVVNLARPTRNPPPGLAALIGCNITEKSFCETKPARTGMQSNAM